MRGEREGPLRDRGDQSSQSAHVHGRPWADRDMGRNCDDTRRDIRGSTHVPQKAGLGSRGATTQTGRAGRCDGAIVPGAYVPNAGSDTSAKKLLLPAAVSRSWAPTTTGWITLSCSLPATVAIRPWFRCITPRDARLVAVLLLRSCEEIDTRLGR